MKLKDKITMLEQRILDLQAIIAIQAATIEYLTEKKNHTVSVWPMDVHPVNHGCIGGEHHVYPSPWMATVPPSCLRCGRQAPSNTFTCYTGDINGGAMTGDVDLITGMRMKNS